MSDAALSPDLILTNATVLTADADDSRAEAVAVWNGRIGAVGGAREIDPLGDGRTKVIDLKGRCVLPGLTDPHVHFADGGAAMMNRIDCRDFYSNVRSIPQIVEFYRMSGDVDYLLRVVVPDIKGYDAVYQRLIREIELSDVSSSFAMEQIKYTTALPLDYA